MELIKRLTVFYCLIALYSIDSKQTKIENNQAIDQGENYSNFEHRSSSPVITHEND